MCTYVCSVIVYIYLYITRTSQNLLYAILFLSGIVNNGSSSLHHTSIVVRQESDQCMTNFKSLFTKFTVNILFFYLRTLRYTRTFIDCV